MKYPLKNIIIITVWQKIKKNRPKSKGGNQERAKKEANGN